MVSLAVSPPAQEPVSPELVLVDPELARALRGTVVAGPAFVVPVRPSTSLQRIFPAPSASPASLARSRWSLPPPAARANSRPLRLMLVAAAAATAATMLASAGIQKRRELGDWLASDPPVATASVPSRTGSRPHSPVRTSPAAPREGRVRAAQARAVQARAAEARATQARAAEARAAEARAAEARAAEHRATTSRPAAPGQPIHRSATPAAKHAIGRRKTAVRAASKPTSSAGRNVRWAAVAGADYYDVIVWRGRTRITDLWPRGPRATIRLRDSKRPLQPGRYLWFAYPGFGARSRGRYGSLAGFGSFTVAAAR